MAGIDYTIPGQIKGVELESPMNAMARAMQLRGLQETSQMNALKMQEYQRAREEENALRQLFSSGLKPDSEEFRNQLYARAPGLAPNIEKGLLERNKTAAEVKYKEEQERKEAAETLSKKLEFHRQIFNPLAVTTPDQAAAHTAAFYENPDFEPYANKMMSKKQAMAQSKALFAKNKFDWLKTQINISGDKILEANERREKQIKDEQNQAYSEYVYDAADKGEVPMSKAEFVASLSQQPAATDAAATATATAPAPADASMVTPAVAATTTADGTKQLPGVEMVAGTYGVHPQAQAFYRAGNKNMGDAIQAAHVAEKKRLEDEKKRGELSGEFQNVLLAEQKIIQLEKNPTPENKRLIDVLKAQIRAANLGKGTNVNVGVKLPAQEKAFEEEIGKGQAKKLLEDKTKAEDARDMLDTVRVGRDILKSGVITGAGADFFVGLNQALKTAGVDFGYADASANSQAYSANMAQNVGKLIKLFGAGTGLSNADRDYAEKMAGGKIALDRSALEKILDIQDRAARNVIKRHNKNAANIKTNVPLTVELEPEAAAPGAIKPYSDAEKERRYQEFKAKQGGK